MILTVYSGPRHSFGQEGEEKERDKMMIQNTLICNRKPENKKYWYIIIIKNMVKEPSEN